MNLYVNNLRKKGWLLLVVMLLFVQCKMKDISVQVTYPPSVILPENVTRIAVVNASVIDSVERALNSVEGVLSGESLKGDRLGSEDCIRAFSDKLNAEKIQTVIPSKHIQTRKITQGVPFLDRDFINKTCRENKAEALAVLEFFDTDGNTVGSTVATVSNILNTGNLNPAPINYQINYQWRLYDTLSNSVIDDFKHEYRATFQPTLPFEPLPTRLIRENGKEIGKLYAQHFLPMIFWQNRQYYKKGNKDFEIASRKAIANDWEGAVELWKKYVNDKDETIAARACYNMAVGSEVLGHVKTATEWAQKAYVNYGLKKARDYMHILDGLPQ